jgi:hypothetical protein
MPCWRPQGHLHFGPRISTARSIITQALASHGNFSKFKIDAEAASKILNGVGSFVTGGPWGSTSLTEFQSAKSGWYNVSSDGAKICVAFDSFSRTISSQIGSCLPEQRLGGLLPFNHWRTRRSSSFISARSTSPLDVEFVIVLNILSSSWCRVTLIAGFRFSGKCSGIIPFSLRVSIVMSFL